jgi:protein-arginine kinase activator protein McsA
MRCNLCKKNKAIISISQKELDKKTIRIDLCSRCARKHGVDDPSEFSLADMMTALRLKESGQKST